MQSDTPGRGVDEPALRKQTEVFFRVRDPLFLVICLLQYSTAIDPAWWGNGSFWFWNILFNREFTSPSFVMTLLRLDPFPPASARRLTTQERIVPNSSYSA